MGAADGIGEVDVGRDALMQQQRVDGKPRLAVAEDAIGHLLDAIAASGRQRHHAAHHLHAALHLAQQAEALGGIGREEEARQMRQRRGPVARGRRIEQRRDLGAGAQILRGDQPEQRSRAGQHDLALGRQARGLQQDLRRAAGHDAGQGPARDREGTLQRAGGEDDVARLDQARGARHGDPDLALPREAPDRGARHVLRAALPERLDELGAVPVVLAENRAVADRRLGDGAIDLSAGRRLLVEKHGIEPEARRRCRRRQPRWSGADDSEVVMVLDRAGGRHRPASRLPCWVSIRMPSRTRMRQAWRLPTPSTVTRQSKQTPIMQ